MKQAAEFCRITFVVILFLGCLLLSDVASATPSIILPNKSGPPTSRILVSGRGFNANVGVDIYFGTKDEALIVTNGKGEFQDVRIHVPRSARPGRHWVTALERDNNKGAQKPFLVETNWSQFHFDADGTRVNPYENVLSPRNIGNIGLKWTYKTGGSVLSSPVVVDGVVYVGSNDSNVYALNATTGKKLWSYASGGGIWDSSPAVVDGVVYVSSGNSELYALNARTGRKMWGYGVYGPGTPAVVNRVVYFGADDYRVYALNARNGTKLWSYLTLYAIQSAPAVVNGVVYIASLDHNVYALDASTGAELWTFVTEGYVGSSPTVANGILYITSWDGNIYALNASTGAKLWSIQTNQCCMDSSAAVSDGVVYVGSNAGYIYALNGSTGAEIWTYSPVGYVPAPAVANGVVYAGTSDDNLYALSASTGERLWSYETGGYVESSPAIVNGTVYVGSDDDNIYAFGLKYGSQRADASSERPDLKTLHPDFNLKVSER